MKDVKEKMAGPVPFSHKHPESKMIYLMLSFYIFSMFLKSLVNKDTLEKITQ